MVEGGFGDPELFCDIIKRGGPIPLLVEEVYRGIDNFLYPQTPV